MINQENKKNCGFSGFCKYFNNGRSAGWSERSDERCGWGNGQRQDEKALQAMSVSLELILTAKEKIFREI